MAPWNGPNNFTEYTALSRYCVVRFVRRACISRACSECNVVVELIAVIAATQSVDSEFRRPSLMNETQAIAAIFLPPTSPSTVYQEGMHA